MSTVAIRQIAAEDRRTWAELRARLWPEETAEEHMGEIERPLAGGELWVFFAEADGKAVGFAEVSLRRYANGCEQMPVPFLEGIWVDQARRRRGVGRALIGHIRAFLKGQGYSELCSDVLLENADSQAAHAAWGFSQTERVVYYRTPV